MNDVAPSKKSFRFTGFHMALCFLGFFGVIISVNIFMATLASRSWTGLVVKNSYVASQKFNDELAAARAQQARGWVSKLKYQSGNLQFKISDRNGNILILEDPIVYLGRPAFEQQDQIFKFETVGHDSHNLAVKLAAGLWDLQIEGLVEGKSYRRDLRILVDGSHSGEVQ